MLPLGIFSACLIDLSPIRCCHTDLSQTSNLNIFVLFILASLTAEVELTRNKEEIDFTVNLMIFRIQQIQIYGHLACCQKTFVSSTLKSTSRLYPRKSIWIGFGWGTIPFEQLKQVVTCISPRFIHIQGDFFNCPPPCSVPKWKTIGSLKWMISWNSSSGWLVSIFLILFLTKGAGERLKQCMMRCWNPLFPWLVIWFVVMHNFFQQILIF